MITSTSETPSTGWMSIGMSRPLSVTVQEPSPFSVTLTSFVFFFFNDTATTEIYTAQYTLSLTTLFRSLIKGVEGAAHAFDAVHREDLGREDDRDRKSTRLNSSHIEPSRMPSSA